MLTHETPLVASKEVFVTDIDGELVMLLVDSGMYFCIRHHEANLVTAIGTSSP